MIYINLQYFGGNGRSSGKDGGKTAAVEKLTPKQSGYEKGVRQLQEMNDAEFAKFLDDVDEVQTPPDVYSGIHAQQMMYQLGMNDKPDVVDDDTFNKIAEETGATILYRGVKSYYGKKRPKITSDEITEQFRYSDTTYIGGGIYGDGNYFSSFYDDSLEYSSGNDSKRGAVFKIMLKPGAKIATQGDLFRAREKISDDLNKKLLKCGKKSPYPNRGEAQLAMKLGYDGFWAGLNYFVLLNRGAAIVSSKNVPRGTEADESGKNPVYH